MKTEVFCENCRETVPFTVSDNIPMRGELDGKSYSYTGKEARCSVCGQPVYVGEIFTQNMQALYDSYRCANGIITVAQIAEILKKYNIGKRPLSQMLGWGELTLTRYCDGDMPSKKYSAQLLQILEDPSRYNGMLEAGKSKISAVAYKKSKQAVCSLLHTKSDAPINNVAKFILARTDDITPLALQKLLYYVQGFYFAFHGTFLFEDDCEAWANGPVFRNIYTRYKQYGYSSISAEKIICPQLPEEQTAIIESVLSNLGCYSGNMLKNFTHAELPWLSAREGLPSDAPSSRIISKQSIGSYFSCVKQKYDITTPADIATYAEYMRGCNRNR